LGYRDELEAFRDKEGNEALWEKLNTVDSDYAAELDPRNYRYVIRGLEIYGKQQDSQRKFLVKKQRVHMIFSVSRRMMETERNCMGKINQRVEEMFRV
jgi:tRNA dimethylallyltransferase